MGRLNLIKNNKLTKLSGKSLEVLNHEKNKLELKNNELFDVCYFSIDDYDLQLPTTFQKIPSKTIKVFKKKIIKVRNDDEQWNDVQGIKDTGGNKDKDMSTIVSSYDAQKTKKIINNNLTFQTLTIFTPNYWYCNSVEFTAISQYYKSGYDTFAKKYWELWYELQGQYLITQKEKKYLPFVNYIKRLGFNYE